MIWCRNRGAMSLTSMMRSDAVAASPFIVDLLTGTILLRAQRSVRRRSIFVGAQRRNLPAAANCGRTGAEEMRDADIREVADKIWRFAGSIERQPERHSERTGQ